MPATSLRNQYAAAATGTPPQQGGQQQQADKRGLRSSASESVEAVTANPTTPPPDVSPSGLRALTPSYTDSAASPNPRSREKTC